jgi:hypothetical protein
MKAARLRLVGYDRQTEPMFGEVRTVVRFDNDDRDAIGCYELTDGQAHQIATMVRRTLPTGLDFFLEAYAP